MADNPEEGAAEQTPQKLEEGNAGANTEASAEQMAPPTEDEPSSPEPEFQGIKNIESLPLIPPITNYTINLLTLTDDEQVILQRVLDKDDDFTEELDVKIRILRREIYMIRNYKLGLYGDPDSRNLSRTCIRCRRDLGIWREVVPLADKGRICQRCRFRVCKNCRHKQANGLWLCNLCVRYREIKCLTGDWMCRGDGGGLSGTELMKLSLKDSEFYRQRRRLLEKLRPKKKKVAGGSGASEKDDKKRRKSKSRRKSVHKHSRKRKHSKSKKRPSKSGKSKKKKHGKGQEGKKDKKGKKGGKGGGDKKKKKAPGQGKGKGGKGTSKKGGDKKKKDKAGKGKKEKGGKGGKKKGKKEKGDKNKKKKGKNKSKNANNQQEDSNASYAGVAELAREDVQAGSGVDVHQDVEESAAAAELALLPQKRCHERSRRRRVQSCDQHLRWQDDERQDMAPRGDDKHGAHGDCGFLANTGSDLTVLEEKGKRSVEIVINNVDTSALDAALLSSGDHKQGLGVEAGNPHSRNEAREGRRRHGHKHRRHARCRFNSDCMLNENNDFRNLLVREMNNNERDYSIDKMIGINAANEYLLNANSKLEKLTCMKRTAVSNLQEADFPIGYVCSDKELSLRQCSEHCYKTSKHPIGSYVCSDKELCLRQDSEHSYNTSKHPIGSYVCSDKELFLRQGSEHCYKTSKHPIGSYVCSDKELCLRQGSEHCYKISKHPDANVQALTFKNQDSHGGDETYTLNTELVDGEWEQQPSEPLDSTLDKLKGQYVSVSEASNPQVQEGAGAVPRIISARGGRRSQNITHEPHGRTSQQSIAEEFHTQARGDGNSQQRAEDSKMDDQPSTVLPEATASSSTFTTQLPHADDDDNDDDDDGGGCGDGSHERPSHPRNKKLLSNFRNSRIIKQVKSLFANILDYSMSPTGFRKYVTKRNRNENYKVHRIAQYTEPPPQRRVETADITHLLQAGGYIPPDKMTSGQVIDEKLDTSKTKSKFNLGEVMLKAKQKQMEQQLLEMQQQKQEKKVKVQAMKVTSSSQTENRKSLASALCPFCRFSIECGVP